MLSPTSSINRPSLHPGTEYLIGPRVPHGLAAVVEGLTREVLRHHPEDIYIFAAHHFEKLLKLREQYHSEKCSKIREFDDEFTFEFNLWPIKKSEDIGISPISGWSLDKKIKILERREKAFTDVEESPEDMSTDREKRKVWKQTCSTSTKRASRRPTKVKDATSDSRATKIIPQMSVFCGSNKTILTKDIKHELRKNKLNSGEKGKLSDNGEKSIQGERRSRVKVSKTDKNTEEKIERTAMTTAGRTSTRRPLKKVRRIETESETETDEIAAKDRLEKSYERAGVKGDNMVVHTESRDRRPEAAAWLSEHSSERKVSSRALSMDRIRAYVLRKFASTASLEVLRSPTYVEQVQEVIDRAAPIIKEKLEEMRRPRGKRSRSVDFAWNEESFRSYVAKDSKKCSDEKENGRRQEKEVERRKSSNGVPEQESNAKKDEKPEDQSTRRSEMIPNVENEKNQQGKRSAGSGKRSRRRESGEQDDFGINDRIIDNDSEHSNKSEYEAGEGHDTLEARLTATQSILEGISTSASELNGARKVGSDEPGEPTASLEVSDHINVVSLPIVRPPSSKNCKNTIKNDSDSLTLPPISPEAPRSTKKKDNLSLPILLATSNGNYSARRSQEQDDSKDAEETSTMRDITSNMEDITVLPEDEERRMSADEAEKDPNSDRRNLISDTRLTDPEESEEDKDIEETLWEDTSRELAENRTSDVSLDRGFEEHQDSTEQEERKTEEIYKDSLNVTPEVVDVSPRPDSLEPDEEREKPRSDDANDNVVRNNTFDDLKDRLIEIEMAERNIEKAFAGQQTAIHNDEAMSEVKKPTSARKIDETRKSVNEAKEVVSETETSTSKRTPNEERKSINEDEKLNRTNEVEKGSNNTEKSMKLNESEISNKEKKSVNEETEEKLTNEVERSSNNIEISMNETENSMVIPMNYVKNSMSEVEESKNEMKMLKNGIKVITNQPSTTVANKELIEEKGSKDQVDVSTNEVKELNGVEELMVKRHITHLESMNTRSQHKDDQIVEMSVCEMSDNHDKKASNGKTVTENIQTTSFGNILSKERDLKTSLPMNENNISETKMRKKREIDEVPATTPLSLKIPFSYVLSEGSPCEIPDCVTTVIIPERMCPSPVIPQIEDRQSMSTYLLTESAARENIVGNILSKDVTRKDGDRAEYGMEVFGEYIRPEGTALPVDIDFMHGVRGAKQSEDIVIVHQDLDRIKEEGEEEGEEEDEDKEDDERGKEEGDLEKNDGQAIAQAEGSIVKLEDIVEHEENETDMKATSESINAKEEILSSCVPECEALAENTENIDLMNGGKTDIAMESRSTLDNSSEENGSSQDIHTTASSDAKESTASNRTIESSSVGRPIVPELNLDSLQDNTVSSFKMTANGTVTKDSNGSPRESNATMSLIEPLTPDERLTIGNRQFLVDREEEIPIFEENSPNFRLLSEVPEADQLYQAEHTEYELLEKDLLSSEAALEDETISQRKKIVDSKASSEDVDLILREKRQSEELDSEEEIARVLIDLLDKEAQLCAGDSGPEKKSENHKKPAESNLDVNDRSKRPLSGSIHSILIDEAKQGKSAVVSETLDDESVAKTETVSELFGHMADSTQENEAKDNKMKNKETEEPRSEVGEKGHIENSQVVHLVKFERDESLAKDNSIRNQDIKEPNLEVEETESIDFRQFAPLAEFEQDELLEENGRHEVSDAGNTAEKKSDVSDANLVDNQKSPKYKQIDVEYVLKSQNNESISKNEKFYEKQTENKQEMWLNRKDREKREGENVEIKEEYQQKELNGEEKREQNETIANEENKQEHLEDQEVMKSKECSLTKSIEKDEEFEYNETIPNKSITTDEIIADDQTVPTSEKEEKIDDLSSKLESVHGLITSEISEQSTKDSPGRYWTMGTKSSTAETVIAAFSSNASMDEKMEDFDDVPKIVKDESIFREKDDSYLAVVKIQACIRGFLARRRLRKDSVFNNVSLAQKAVVIEHLPEDHSNLREVRSGRFRLRREEALRKTTLSLENAFATSRLQHTGEFHDSVPLPLFNIRNSETNSSDLLNESLDKEIKEEETTIDTAKSSKCETTDCNCYKDEHQGNSQKDAFDHSDLPIVMHLLADASRNCHVRINRNSEPDLNLNPEGAKLMEPALDILMLGYLRDDATLENRYLNFITSVEDVSSNVDFLSPDVATKKVYNADDAQLSKASGETSVSFREPLALPGTPQGVVIEELTSLDEVTGDLSSTKSESTEPSTKTKISLEPNSSVPLEEYILEDKKNNSETSPKTNPPDKDNTIRDQKNTVEEVERESKELSVTNRNFQSVGKIDLDDEETSEKSTSIFCGSNGHADEGEGGKM